MRWLASWALYLAGDLIWRFFSDWTSIGLRGAPYSAYEALLRLSLDMQGDGPGPWEAWK